MAATQLYYAKTGVATRHSYPDNIDKSMDTYLIRTSEVPIEGAMFFKDEKATTLEHKITTLGRKLNTPRRSEDTDPLPLEQPAHGYDKTVTLYTYRNGVAVTRTMMKIDQSGRLRWMMSGLPESGRRLKELAYADVINTGEATAGADGSNLFGTDHYHEDAAGGTWSNLETAAALTTTTFATMRTNMQKRSDEKGMVGPIELDKLVVPVDLYEKAKQIAGSDKVPETTTHGVNVWKGVSTQVWHYLTSATAWYGWGSLPEEMWGLHDVTLTPPNIMALDYPSADYPDIVAGWRIYMQFAVAGSQLKNMHKNAGA